MKYVRTCHPVLACLLTLSLPVTAYGQQVTATDAGVNLSGTVSGWDQGEAELTILLFGEGFFDDYPSVATSTIAEDGSFMIAIPESIPDEALTEGGVFSLCERGRFDGTVSTQTWREAFAALMVRRDGEALGLVTPASSEAVAGFNQSNDAGDFFIGLLYVDRNIAVQGNCGRGGFVSDYDIELTEGWNQVIFTVEEDTEPGSAIMSVRSVTRHPEGTGWYFTPLEDLWRSTEQ